MRSIIRIRFACLLLLGFFGSIVGQERAQQMGVGLDIAGIRLAGGNKGDSNVNGWFGFTFNYYATNSLAIGYTGHYGHLQPNDGSSFFKTHPDLTFRTILFSHTLDATYYLPLKTKFLPFISAGTGLLWWDLRDTPDGGSLFSDGLFYGDSQYDGVRYNSIINAAIGSELPLASNLSLRGYFRFTHIFDQKNDNIGTGDINDQLLQLGLNLSYRFGGMKDSDSDGIFDKYDKAPHLAEDFDNFQDEDGIPDFDNDNDSVVDNEDQAPLVPEDIDGFEDRDGVPDPDNDWDGIPDALDGAANEPEDLDGYQDEDGIPDSDNDNDGIPDLTDKCKDTPETFNGYRDDDGCPDEIPKPILDKGERIILQGVNFELNSAELVKTSYAILDEVYESLYMNPEIQVEIRGYTDNTGSDSYNVELSQRRAETVRRYLIENGIDSNRITAKGFGEADPIADNSTEAGRAKNRRIEFYRID